MKKLLSVFSLLVLTFVLTGCWNGEIAVTTEFEADGSGTRTLVLDVMDDTLADGPIVNPDDPEESEGKGAVLNNEHITGGLPAIQTWLEDNSPSWITVEDMTTDGYHRYFTLSYDFTDFEDFINRYKELVNMSPNLSWNDFEETDYPTWECKGSIKKSCTFTESKSTLEASLDWAIDGIYNDLYDATSLAGYVTKDNISVLADYTLFVGDNKVEDLHAYDPDAPDGDDCTGKVVYVANSEWTASDDFTNTTLIYIIVGAAVVVVGGAVFGILKFKK